MASFCGRPHSPWATSAPVCCVSLLFHFPPLFWLQGDSPGPVQKNLHNPIVQVGVLPWPLGPSFHPIVTRNPSAPCSPGPLASPLPYLGHPRQRGVKPLPQSVMVWFLSQAQYLVCPSLSSFQSVDLLSASHIFHPAALVSSPGSQRLMTQAIFRRLAAGYCSLFIFNIWVPCHQRGGATGRKTGIENQKGSLRSAV